MKNMKLLSLGLATVLTVGLTACGSSSQTASAGSSTAETTADGVEKVYYAFTTNNRANSYIDENGNADGYEYAAVKAIFDELPQYELELVPTTDEDLLVGLESGKYDIGTKGAWWTAARAENYIYPENYIGSSIIGITVRSEDADKYKDLESFAKEGGKLVPLSPQNAQYNIIQNFNTKHPDTPIQLDELDVFLSNDSYQWVLEGRYDAYVDIRSSFDTMVTAEDGEYHNYADKLTYITYEAIPTWAFFNKDNQELADAFDEALVKLREEGVFEELSQKYYGYSIFEYIPEGYQKGDDL